MSNTGKNLHQRLVAVGDGIGIIRKTGRHQQFGYSFFTDADLSDPIRQLLVEHGVVFTASVTGHTREEFPTSKGGISERVTVHMRFAFVNADHPEDREVYDWTAHITDPNDRGLSKAIANARKTFLVTQFLVCEESGEAAKPPGTAPKKAADQTADSEDPRKAEYQKMRDWFAAAKAIGAEPTPPEKPDELTIEGISSYAKGYKRRFYSTVADLYTVLADKKLNQPADDSDQHAFESFSLAKQIRIAQAWRARIEKAGE